MILNIIKYGNDNGKLRKTNINTKNNDHAKELISNLLETIDYYGYHSLSAPQVGKNLNLFVISLKGFREVFINPKIKAYGHNIQITEECPSLQGTKNVVNRKAKVKVEYHDKNWKYKLKEFEGEISKIIQHEYDHLIGKLTIDY